MTSSLPKFLSSWFFILKFDFVPSFKIKNQLDVIFEDRKNKCNVFIENVMVISSRFYI